MHDPKAKADSYDMFVDDLRAAARLAGLSNAS